MSAREWSDAEFLAAMEAATYPGAEFGHVGHLRLGWLCLRAHGLEAGLGRIRRVLRHYSAALGAAEKFHETLTRAWAERLWAAMEAAPELETFQAFLEAHPELRSAQWLERHYRKETLDSPAAREGWVAPDLEPLPGPGPASH